MADGTVHLEDSLVPKVFLSSANLPRFISELMMESLVGHISIFSHFFLSQTFKKFISLYNLSLIFNFTFYKQGPISYITYSFSCIKFMTMPP